MNLHLPPDRGIVSPMVPGRGPGPADRPLPADERRPAAGDVEGTGWGAQPDRGFDPRLVALAGLLRCCEPPAPLVLRDFVAAVGAQEAWTAITRGCAPAPVAQCVAPRVGGLDRAALAARAVQDLRQATAAGAELIGPGDPQWPGECFAPLDDLFAYDGCPSAAAPLALYRRGGAWPVTTRGAVAVVGSRSATPYGVSMAMELGAELSGRGFTIVSGAAFGIDAAAHRGALHGGGSASPPRCAGGVTVAVLACGIERWYPVAHRSLLDAAAASGAVVSEYPPGSVPARHRFLVRNRLIAAFAEATVVVEAGRRSGSLNTATSAQGMGRQVLAVPGPVTSAMSVGCHDLIRDHKAELVTDAGDVAGLLGSLQPAAPAHRRGDRATDGLDLVAARVHEALPARGSAGVDRLATDAGLPLPDVLAALAVLQVEGLADRVDGAWRRVARR